MIRRAGFALLLVLLAAPRAHAQLELPIRRLPAGRIDIPSAGVAVIRSQAQWELLWRRYSSHMWDGTTGARIPPLIPAVDFRRDMVVVVSYGPMSGCSNERRWITRVTDRRDSVIVRLGPLPSRNGFATCAAMVHPAELAVIPRRDRPVVFGGPIRPPRPADWLRTPTDAQLDALPDHGLHILEGQALDPATTPQRIAWLVSWAARHGNADVGELLLARPEVRRNANFIAQLTALPDHHGRQVKEILVREFATTIAADPRAPMSALRALLDSMNEPGADPRVAELLIRNPTVRGSKELLILYTREGQRNAALWDEACRTYLARWPAWEKMEGRPADDPSSYSSALVCPNLPGLPLTPDGRVRLTPRGTPG